MENIKNFSDLCTFTPRQKDALQATKDYKYVLYGGTMYSGKSFFLRWATVYWLLKLSAKYKKKGIRAGLFCEDYGSLNDRHISKIKTDFPRALGQYNEQRHEFTLWPWLGGGVIAFRNLDEPNKYLSSEFAIIAVDEINRNPYSTFRILRTRLRWPGMTETKFMSACNPIGEPWVKRFWVDRNFPPEEQEQEQFFFVPAKPTDNPYLDEGYFKALESLDEKEKKAFLEGDWAAFEDDMDEEGWMKLVTDRELQNALQDEVVHVGVGVLGVDPAAGGDKSSVVYKTDTAQEVVFSQRLNDILMLVPVIAEAIIKYNVKQIVVDRSGVGEGLYQRLKELNYNVKGVSFQELPSDKQKFFNLKAELYWKEKEWIMKNGGRLKRHNGWNDFLNIKWRKHSDSAIRIQSKDELRKRGFRSPDVVDAAVLTHVVKNAGFHDFYKGITFKDKIKDIWNNK